MKTSYVAICGQAGDGTWSGYIPDLSCVIGMGTSLELCHANLQEALGFWAEAMRESGSPIPSSSGVAALGAYPVAPDCVVVEVQIP